MPNVINNRIKNETHKIIREKWTDGLSICHGSIFEHSYYNSGIISGSDSIPVSEYTLFDLASVTKLFTLITVMKLVEDHKISLTDTVNMYSTKFSNLSSIKIYELMNFSIQLETEQRIDSCITKEEALKLLYQIQPSKRDCQYTDMGTIVLTKIIDEILSPYSSFSEYSKQLWKEQGLKDTFWWYDCPKNKWDRLQNYDCEYQQIAENLKLIHTPLGTVHDKKAALLGSCGHAGIFSCSNDIRIFSQRLLSGQILHPKTINIILSSQYDSYSKNNHFGLLSYKKYTDPKQSEIPAVCSTHTLAISGYTGTYLLWDFEKRKFLFIGGNRIFYRLTNASKLKNTYSSMPPIKAVKKYVYRKDILRDLIFNE